MFGIRKLEGLPFHVV